MFPHSILHATGCVRCSLWQHMYQQSVFYLLLFSHYIDICGPQYEKGSKYLQLFMCSITFSLFTSDLLCQLLTLIIFHIFPGGSQPGLLSMPPRMELGRLSRHRIVSIYISISNARGIIFSFNDDSVWYQFSCLNLC